MSIHDENGSREAHRFGEYRMHILSELRRLGDDIRGLNEKIDELLIKDLSKVKAEVMLLKFQAWLGGAIAGAIATGIISFLIRMIK